MAHDFRPSIVVVTFNQVKVLGIMLESLLLYTDPSLAHDVSVICQSADDSTRALVGGQISYSFWSRGIKFHADFLSSNIGCAAGWNHGIRTSVGDPVIILNDDIVMSPGWLRNLLSFLEKNPKSLPSCHVLDHPDYGRLFEYNKPEWEKQSMGIMELEKGVTEEGMQGPAMCLTRSILGEVGLFDEGYWKVAYEDADYVVRAEKLGRPPMITHSSVVFHYGGTTQSYVSGTQGSEHLARNRARFENKWQVNLSGSICNRSIFWRNGVRVVAV